MDEAELRFQLQRALDESRAAGPAGDLEIARRYAGLLARQPSPDVQPPEEATDRALIVEVVAALAASLTGLAGVVYAARQFAAATALYGFYPAGSHGRLLLVVLALFCLGLSAGAVLHAVLDMRIGVPILIGSGIALILGAIYVAIYTGPKDMTLEYTQLIPSGAIALITVATAALASIATLTALASAFGLGARRS